MYIDMMDGGWILSYRREPPSKGKNHEISGPAMIEASSPVPKSNSSQQLGGGYILLNSHLANLVPLWSEGGREDKCNSYSLSPWCLTFTPLQSRWRWTGGVYSTRLSSFASIKPINPFGGGRLPLPGKH